VNNNNNELTYNTECRMSYSWS